MIDPNGLRVKSRKGVVRVRTPSDSEVDVTAPAERSDDGALDETTLTDLD